MARLPAIPESVVDEFSKRSREGEEAARAWAKRQGRDWDELSPEQQAAFKKQGTHATRLDKGLPINNRFSDVVGLEQWCSSTRHEIRPA
jgi:hypothetical protein